jgi:hypothetical protein
MNNETNKIPTNNSIQDLKIYHNQLIDNMNKLGYENLITNGDFSLTIEASDEDQHGKE